MFAFFIFFRCKLYPFIIHLLTIVLGRAAQTASHAIDEYDDGRGAPAECDEPFDQPLLGNECGDEDGVQIESLAEHPGVIGQEEVV